MGAEVHSYLMPPLVSLASGRKPKVPPMKGDFGDGGVNKKMARVAGQMAAGNPGAIERCRLLYKEFDRAGDSCMGNGNDLFSGSHWQIVGGAKAAHLLCAARAGADRLRRRIEASIRIETAAMARCYYLDVEGARKKTGPRVGVLTGGSRGKDERKTGKGKGRELVEVVRNSARDFVCELLVLNMAPRLPDDLSFDVAVSLLQRALREGVRREDLVGGPADLAQLDRFGWHVAGDACEGEGDFYSWFERLEGADNPLFGAGRIGGVEVLEWEPGGARERGEMVRAAA